MHSAKLATLRLRVEILLLNRYTDEIGCLTHLGFRKEAGVKKPNEELTNSYSHGVPRGVEVL
jgi:hypothetical protein